MDFKETIQILYFISASIGIMAMIPQLQRLIKVKQSDGLSLTTWLTWAGCQVVSFMYATSIGATPYMIVGSVWIGFYITMSLLIIKYRKRRSLIETIRYWMQRGHEEKSNALVFQTEKLLSSRPAEKMN